jgi:hypothetical protein
MYSAVPALDLSQDAHANGCASQPVHVVAIEHVSYYQEMTERPRLALRQPRSLAPEQLGDLDVSMATTPTGVSVNAWVVWEDGVEELVNAHAIAWTRRAVRVKFGAPPRVHTVWVWAGAVERT